MPPPLLLGSPACELKSFRNRRGAFKGGEGLRVWDLLLWSPRRFITLAHHPRDRDRMPESVPLWGDLETKRWAFLEGALSSKSAFRRGGRKGLWSYTLELSSGEVLELCCFTRPYWHHQVGSTVLVLGAWEEGSGGARMIHPKLWPITALQQELGLRSLLTSGLMPLYPPLGDWPEMTLQRAMQEGLERLQASQLDSLLDGHVMEGLTLRQALLELHGRLPEPYTATQGLPSFEKSLTFQRARHRLGLEEWATFRMRLMKSFQEVPQRFRPLSSQVHERRQLARWWENSKAPIPPSYAPLQHWREQLPFALRSDQIAVLQRLTDKLLGPLPMRALLLGDVGSGKTVVAVGLALITALQGRSVLVMVPNLLLAHQHHQTFSTMLAGTGIPVHWMTGGSSSLDQGALEAGAILIATQAPLYQKPQLQALGLLVLDEQHRFGIEQKRQSLADLSDHYPHQLMMSATPIPRTLHLAQAFPENIFRLEAPLTLRRTTHILSVEQLPKLLQRWQAAQQLPKPGLERIKVFWICARIEDKADSPSELQSLRQRLKALKAAPELEAFTLLSLNGRMGEQEKLEALKRFREASHALLVSTTAVEVGIDVSDANFLVIENAEHFGLAQIHQLRGRIGRAQQTAYCFLCVQGPLDPLAQRRLEILKHHQDGATVAAWDLKLRGHGETFSLKQSGLQGDFRFFRNFNSEAEAQSCMQVTSSAFSVERLQSLHDLWALPNDRFLPSARKRNQSGFEPVRILD